MDLLTRGIALSAAAQDGRSTALHIDGHLCTAAAADEEGANHSFWISPDGAGESDWQPCSHKALISSLWATAVRLDDEGFLAVKK